MVQQQVLLAGRFRMRLMAHFFRAYPLHTALMLAALLLSGIAEGIGLSALLPLLNIALGADAGIELVATGTEVQNDFERVVLEILGALGITVTLGNMLLIIVSGVLVKSVFLLLAAARGRLYRRTGRHRSATGDAAGCVAQQVGVLSASTGG